jgi:hypothetical protein
MSQQAIIMVQINEPQWMQEVLSTACTVAQECGGRIILVKMVRVAHESHLGNDHGPLQLDEQEQQLLQAYANAIAACGIECTLEFYRCWDLYGAIADAAREMGATVVFANHPRSRIPFWSASRFEVLRQHMAHSGQQLFDRVENKDGDDKDSQNWHFAAAQVRAS